MHATTTSPALQLAQLAGTLKAFPEATPESPLLYNHVKLLRVLQRQELLRYTDEATANEALQLLVRYSESTSLLNQRRFEEALGNAREVDELIGEKFKGEVYLFAIQWGLSVKALYYHKQQSYDRAFAITLECVALNDYLVRAGFGTLLFRLLEQNVNLTRICSRTGAAERGANLFGDLLQYLLNGESGGLYGSVFADPQFWRATPYLREASAFETFKRAVYLLIEHKKHDPAGECELFGALFGRIGTFEITTPERQVFYNWLYLKRLYYAGEYGQFLGDLTEFMEEPLSKSFDLLKLSLLQNVIRLAEDGGAASRDFCLGEITDFINHKLDVHADLKALVCGE
jgi:hypothetical protein